MKFTKDEEAVSPVIGVILMVAITVILAAVIATFVFGMAGNIQVAVTANKNSSGGIDIILQGGQDVDKLEVLNVSVNNTVYVNCQKDDIAIGKVYPTGQTFGRVVVVGQFNDGTSQVLLDREFT